MDQIVAMRAFVRVVETESFSKAAASLQVSKPNLSRLVQSLELRLRTQLLVRNTRRLGVTREGSAYYARVKALLADLEDIDASLMRERGSPQGRLRIEVGASFGTHVLMPALASFTALYPDIELDVGVGDRPVDFVAGNVDAVIHAGAIHDQSLVARRIGDIRYVTCASPAYLKRHGVPRRPQDLEATHVTIGCCAAPSGRAPPLSFSRDGERVERIEVGGRRACCVNDGNAHVAAGRAGLGIIQAPAYAVHSSLAAGELVAVLPGWSPDAMPAYVAYAPNRYVTAKLRAFIEWISALFGASAQLRRMDVALIARRDQSLQDEPPADDAMQPRLTTTNPNTRARYLEFVGPIQQQEYRDAEVHSGVQAHRCGSGRVVGLHAAP